MKKISKSMAKKIALMVMLSSAVGMQSAWAEPETVTINNSEPYVTGITRGGGGCYKPDGTTEAHGNNPEVCGIRNTTNPDPGSGDYGAINSIVTNGAISTKNVHGVWMILGHNVTIDSLSGGITLQGTAGVTGIDVNSGNTYDTLTVSNMGNISATGTGSESKVYGISATKGTASIAGDANNKATISVAATSTYGSGNNRTAVAVYVSGTTLTLENYDLSTGLRQIGTDENAALTVSAGDVANTVLNLKNTTLGGKISAGTTNALQLNFKGTDSEWKLGGADSVTGTINASVESGGIVTLIAADTAVDAANAQTLSAVIGGAGTVKFGNGTDSRYFKTSADNVKATTNQVADNTTLILTSGTLSNTLTKGTTNSAIWIGDGTNAAEVKATTALYTAVEPEIKTNGTLLLDSNTLSSMNSGAGTIKLNQDVTVGDGVTITGTLDANGKTLNMHETGDVAYSTLSIGTLKGTAKLNIDLDMSNFENIDKLSVGSFGTDAVVDLTNINVKNDVTLSGEIEFPSEFTDAITYVTSGGGTATYKINGTTDGSVTATNNYKYTFTAGAAGKLSFTVEAAATTFKELVEGTEDITLSLTKDMNYSGAAADSMNLGNNMNINLNNNNLTSTNTSTVNVVDGKTMSIDGGSGTTAGTLAANYTWTVADGGTLNLSGKTKVEGTINGAGAVVNTGDLTIDAAKLAVTNANGLVNNGTVTIGAGALGSVITGTGETVIAGAVTSDKKITQGDLTINDVGTLSIDVANLAITNDIVNNGTLTFNGTAGTLTKGITGTGMTVFATNMTVDVALVQAATVNTGVELDVTADNLQGDVTNKGTLTLGDGTLTKDILDNTGTTVVDGTVIASGKITQQKLTINADKSLSVDNAGNLTLGEDIDNKGTLTFTGSTAGTLSKGIKGTGNTVFAGKTTVSGALQQAATVNSGAELTIDAANLQATDGLTNDGTVTIGAGALGSVIIGTGKTVINGAVTSDKKITQTQLNIADGGSLDISVANFDVNNGVENKGTLKLSGGGTIAVPITGGTTGTTTFKDSNTTMNSAIQTNVTVESGAGLAIKADSLQGVITNGGTLTLGDGVLKKNITGTGKTIIDGDVSNDEKIGPSITQKDLTINKGKSLKVNDWSDLTITNSIDNKGTLSVNGGTIGAQGSSTIKNGADGIVKVTGSAHIANGAVTTGTLEFGNNQKMTYDELNSFTYATILVGKDATLTLLGGTAAESAKGVGKVVSGDGTFQLGDKTTMYFGKETDPVDAEWINAATNIVAENATLNLTGILSQSIINNGTIELRDGGVTFENGAAITGSGTVKGNITITDDKKPGEVKLSADTFSKNKDLQISPVYENKTLILEGGTLTRDIEVKDGGTVKLAGTNLDAEHITNGTLEFAVAKEGEEQTYELPSAYVKTAKKNVDEGVTLKINGTTIGDVLGGNISNAGTLEIKNVALLSGSEIENYKTMTLTNIAAVGSEENQVDITNDGTMTIDNKGEIVVYGNIKKSEGAADTKLEIKSGSVVFKGWEIHNPVVIGKGAKFDPVADTFYDEVTNNGNLVLEGGNLNVKVVNSGESNTLTITDSVTLTDAGTFKFDADSTLEIAMSKEAKFFAANEAAVTNATAAIANIANTDQVEGIDDIKIKLTGTAENGGYYAVLGSKEGSDNIFILSDNIFILSKDQIDYSADPEITAIELTKIGNALTIQTIKTTKAEENVNCFAGVQQGMISVTNQVTDAVADHLGLLAMDRVEKGKYSKGIWASYIRNKDNSDGMNTFSSAADGSNPGSFGSNYTSQVNGVTVGADLFASEKAVGGLAINYATGTTTGSGADAILNNKTKYYGVEFYNRITNKHHAVLMDIGYMRGNNEISAIDKKNWTADADVNTITAGVRWERDFNLKGGSKLVPFAGLRYIRLQNKDFSNSKGLDYSTNNQNLYQPKLGVAWTGEYKMNKSDWTFKPKAEVGYLWALGNKEAETTSRIKSYTAISKYDVTDKSSYYAKLGMEFKRSNFAAGVDYSYMKGNAVRSNKINVNLSWSF